MINPWLRLKSWLSTKRRQRDLLIREHKSRWQVSDSRISLNRFNNESRR